MNYKKYIRNKFRTSVFERDGFKCVICEKADNLDAHHITDRSKMPNGGYVKENGITLCQRCHLLAERFHVSNGKDFAVGMHPNDLYIKINSSHEKAIFESKYMYASDYSLVK